MCDVKLVNLRCPRPSSFDGNVMYVFSMLFEVTRCTVFDTGPCYLAGVVYKMSTGGVRVARTMSTGGVRGVRGVLQGGKCAHQRTMPRKIHHVDFATMDVLSFFCS